MEFLSLSMCEGALVVLACWFLFCGDGRFSSDFLGLGFGGILLAGAAYGIIFVSEAQ